MEGCPQGEELGETLGRGQPTEGPQGPQSRLREGAGLSPGNFQRRGPEAQ